MMNEIDITAYIAIEPKPDPGAAPMLQWIKIASLVIDDSYQREISGRGRKTIRKIAEAFSWSKFAPVIVSPVAGGHFAIVDGQHRTTAAALVGITDVPCQVIIATAAEQAAAFHAINGAVTQMTSLQMHHAALIAGDDHALAIADVCARAEVNVLRSQPSAADIKPGQTRAVKAIANCLHVFGNDVIVTALQCVTQTANRECVGLLQGSVIRGLCEMLRLEPQWLDTGERLLAVFDDIDIEGHLEHARQQKKMKGESTATVLAKRLQTELRSKQAVAA